MDNKKLQRRSRKIAEPYHTSRRTAKQASVVDVQQEAPIDDNSRPSRRGEKHDAFHRRITAKHERRADWRERILARRVIASDGTPTPTYRSR